MTNGTLFLCNKNYENTSKLGQRLGTNTNVVVCTFNSRGKIISFFSFLLLRPTQITSWLWAYQTTSVLWDAQGRRSINYTLLEHGCRTSSWGTRCLLPVFQCLKSRRIHIFENFVLVRKYSFILLNLGRGAFVILSPDPHGRVYLDDRTV